MTTVVPSIGNVLERERAEEARALLRVHHARMYPGGCPHHCSDCRTRLGVVQRVHVEDVDGVGGWEGLGMALGAMALALGAGLAWLVLSGRLS